MPKTDTRRRLSAEARQQIVALRQSGAANREIAGKIGCSVGTVVNVSRSAGLVRRGPARMDFEALLAERKALVQRLDEINAKLRARLAAEEQRLAQLKSDLNEPC